MFKTPAHTITSDLLNEIMDVLPDAVIWTVPVMEDDRITDFEIKYINETGANYSGKEPILMVNKRIIADGLPSKAICRQIFEQNLEAYSTPVPLTYTYYNPYIGKEVEVLRRRLKDGVLTITRGMKSPG